MAMDNTHQTKSSFSSIRSPILSLSILVVLCLGLAAAPIYLLRMLDRSGTYHNTADIADLDGDGDLDVILHNLRNESETTSFGWTTLWVNQGNGRFSAGSIEMPELPPYLYLSAVGGDVDRDGDTDLLLLSSDHIRLVLNQGGTQGGENGVFKVNNNIRPAGNTGTPGSVVLGDLNNDGQVDGFVAGCCGMSWSTQSGEQYYLPPISWVWINDWDSSGWLVRYTISLEELEGIPIRDTALGDLDGDGDLDVFAAVQTPKQGRDTSPADLVLLNDGSGNLTDSGQRLGESDSSSVALSDLDGDGDLDALVGTRNGAVVWTNQGGAQGRQAGIFAASSQEITGKQTVAVFLSDLDADGDQDALIAGIQQALVWWNGGQGTFTPSGQRFRYSKRHGLAVGDLNDDSRPDIFAAAYSEDYNIWMNQGNGKFK